MSHRRCCCSNCQWCADGGPAEFVATIAGIGNGLCTDCAGMDGAYACTRTAATAWSCWCGTPPAALLPYQGQAACTWLYANILAPSICQNDPVINGSTYYGCSGVVVTVSVVQGTDGTFAIICTLELCSGGGLLFWQIYPSRPACTDTPIALTNQFNCDSNGLCSYGAATATLHLP